MKNIHKRNAIVGEEGCYEAEKIYHQILLHSLVSNHEESMRAADFAVYDFSIDPNPVYSHGF